MKFRLKPRLAAHYCAGLALALVPLAMTTVSPSAGPDDVRPPRPGPTMAAELPFGDDEPSDWAVSRSAHRFDDASASVVVPAVAVREGDREVRVSSPKGTRVWTASAMTDHDVPAAAARAYRRAARTIASTDPSCQLPWTLLAAIGRVESDHGRYGGSVLGTDGISRPLIIGVQLNGAGPVAAISDTDDGKLDRDKVWDRAVGPMQFIPSTWAGAARDGDGDGVASPNDIDDAALAAAAYLCSGYGSVLGDSAMAAAIFRYNQSDYYVALVMAFERGYRSGVFILPPPPEPEDEQKAKRKKKRAGDRDRTVRTADDEGTRTTSGDRDTTGTRDTADGNPKGTPTRTPSPSPSPTPTDDPDNEPEPQPQPEPEPEPVPEPDPEPDLVGLSGALAACGYGPSGWCVNGKALDLGPDTQLARQAAADYSGEGETLTNEAELSSISGADGAVELLVEMQRGIAVVYVINDQDYRYRDGSFA